MSIVKTNTAHRGSFDHFEPESNMDAAEQRRLRGALEQIDYTAYEANLAVLRQAPGALDLTAMKRLATAAAVARAQWVAVAMRAVEAGAAPSRELIQGLAERRMAYDELREAYEGIRRMIERGYIDYKSN